MSKQDSRFGEYSGGAELEQGDDYDLHFTAIYDALRFRTRKLQTHLFLLPFSIFIFIWVLSYR